MDEGKGWITEGEGDSGRQIDGDRGGRDGGGRGDRRTRRRGASRRVAMSLRGTCHYLAGAAALRAGL